jgi:hypothetical protein
VAKGEAMNNTKKQLLEKIDYIKRQSLGQIDYLSNNVAWKWQFERLQSEVTTFKNVLIEAGILVSSKGINQTIIVVDGEQYSIRKVK